MAQLNPDDLTKFMFSPSWSSSRDLLLRHPELLDPSVEELIEGYIAAMGHELGDLQIRELRQQLDLLRRCRQVGVAAAIAELSAQPRLTVGAADLKVYRQKAEAAQQQYERTGEVSSLNLAINLWMEIFTKLKEPAALRRVIAAYQEGVRLAPPESGTQFLMTGMLGEASLFLFMETGETSALRQNLPVIKRAIAAIESKLRAAESSGVGDPKLRQTYEKLKKTAGQMEIALT